MRVLADRRRAVGLESGIIIHRGHIYIPKDNGLRRDIVKQYHEHPAIGQSGRWKTYELISREGQGCV